MKHVPFNKLFIDNKEKYYLNEVIKNKNLTDGIFQNKCEKLIKKITKSKEVFLTQSCTSALEIISLLIGVKKGDEVIMPSFTFTSTANAIVLRGAKPIFVDINNHDLNISSKLVEKKITKKTKAIILVHYSGLACEMQEYLRLKKKYNIFLIEDAAHGFLGLYKNKYLGTIGDFGAFSFHETKNIIGGQCGALLINNAKYISRTKIILDKGTNRSAIQKSNFTKASYYSWKGVGSEFRSQELSSSLLFSQLQKSKTIQEKRKKIFLFYYNFISKIKSNSFFILKNSTQDSQGTSHIFPIIFIKKNLKEKFIKYMQKNKISCYTHYFPLHMSTYGRKFGRINLPVTEKIFDGLVRLPLYPSLSNKELFYIKKKIEFFLSSI